VAGVAPHAESPKPAATTPTITYLRTQASLAPTPPEAPSLPLGETYHSSRVISPDILTFVDDAELLIRLQGGDRDAFTELVQRYQDPLVRLARYYVASEASAQDVAQETWIAVLRGLERFEGRSSFKTWLFHIAANRARTKGVREHRSIPVDLGSDQSLLAGRFNQGGMWSDPPVPFSDSVDDALDNAPLVARVHESIARLPEVARAVVTLRDVQGLSTGEVANLLMLSEANVRVILHRARSRIRSEVEAQMRGGEA
jgi:RNA polymerase sigma-70 factor (ECF subfamily)